MSRTVLLLAAESHEFDGLVRRLPGAEPLEWPVDFARTAEVNGQRWILIANGPGPSLAREAVDVAFRENTPDAIVSTGLCGALDPRLEIGQIVVASEIIANHRHYACRTPWVSFPYATGVVVSTNRVAATASDKSSLRMSGACAVEMEAAGLIDRLSGRDTALYCVRAVSDLANEELPLDFNLMRNQSGRFSRGRIVLAAAARPWTRVPGLWRLGRNSAQAAELLGDFLAECRF